VSAFVKQGDVKQDRFDWGVIGWRVVPTTGSRALVVMDVTLEPGSGHDFHRHPGQEEVIIVKQGQIVQYIEQQSTLLGPGDSVYLDEGVVHASFNDGGETAHLQVVIGPSLGGETGYGLEDVSAEEPWSSVRATAAGA
jgi:quercetin dioxygenase-like cupin family protein